jgi:hypothetical protein
MNYYQTSLFCPTPAFHNIHRALRYVKMTIVPVLLNIFYIYTAQTCEANHELTSIQNCGRAFLLSFHILQRKSL